MIKLFFLSMLFTFHAVANIDEANTFYAEALHAKTRIERKNAFNQALSLYNELESKGTKSTKLYAAQGDIYYHLEEYPWAILYYYRALELTPANSEIEKHLKLAQDKLGLPQKIERSWMNRMLSAGGYFPLSYRYFCLFLATCATVLIVSLFIWFHTPILRRTASILLALEGLFFLNIFLSLYLTPIEGVLINPTGMYRGAGWDQPQLYAPLVKGIKVRVLEEEEQGKWLKIVSPDGTIGYIPWTAIRII